LSGVACSPNSAPQGFCAASRKRNTTDPDCREIAWQVLPRCHRRRNSPRLRTAVARRIVERPFSQYTPFASEAEKSGVESQPRNVTIITSLSGGICRMEPVQTCQGRRRGRAYRGVLRLGPGEREEGRVGGHQTRPRMCTLNGDDESAMKHQDRRRLLREFGPCELRRIHLLGRLVNTAKWALS
jgi:hypothetical protein